jgi:hypothetical protein
MPLREAGRPASLTTDPKQSRRCEVRQLHRRYGHAEPKRKRVTRKVAREIADFLQTSYDMLRQDGHPPEDARLSARENTALTYIEKGYEKEGVWDAYMGLEPKEN